MAKQEQKAQSAQEGKMLQAGLSCLGLVESCVL